MSGSSRVSWVSVKPFVSFGSALQRDTKLSLCEGQVACVQNPTNNGLGSPHPHRAVGVGPQEHAGGPRAVHLVRARRCALAITRPSGVAARAAVCKKSPWLAHAHARESKLAIETAA